MKRKIPIKQLLRWQLAQAEAAAPSAPRARRLLEAARPWWETQPEQFRDLADQLDRVKIAHGDAMAKLKATSAGHPVPVLIIHRSKNVETSACVISLNVRDGTLRLHLRLKTVAFKSSQDFEVTFVNSQLRPLFSAVATPLKNKACFLDVELPEPLASDWEKLNVKDPMPFRLMVRLGKDGD
jgi:hypothetical protein